MVVPTQMWAVSHRVPATAAQLQLTQVPVPVPRADELLVRVRATALNRADILQRRGLYPAPPGASAILGLEVVGEVVQACGAWQVGQRVMAVVTGGGYAEYCCVPAAEAMAVPDTVSDVQAAAIPEAFLTAWLNLITLGALQPAESVFVHAGASGVGSMAIQLAQRWGAHVYTAAGTPEKRQLCTTLGATLACDSRNPPHAEVITQATNGAGVHIVVDMLGAPAWDDNTAMLARGGRLLLVGLLAGAKAPIDLGVILGKSLTIAGTTLRRTPAPAKATLVAAASAWLLPRLARGDIVAVVDSTFSMAQVSDAHARMEANANAGKIVLVWP
ncbi:MAG: NAD(P)H-quinone oxidoreductase [Roseiflexaceae bacterium]